MKIDDTILKQPILCLGIDFHSRSNPFTDWDPYKNDTPIIGDTKMVKRTQNSDTDTGSSKFQLMAMFPIDALALEK